MTGSQGQRVEAGTEETKGRGDQGERRPGEMRPGRQKIRRDETRGRGNKGERRPRGEREKGE